MTQPLIEERFAAVVDDITEYCMKAKEEKWKGGFSGMVIITVPTELDGAVGNVAGFFGDEFEDSQDEVMGTGLISLLTGLLLMGWDETMLLAAVEAARQVASRAELIDVSNLPVT